MAGFKDFYQYVDHTRVIAGRGLIESTGFEFMKEGADRVFIVTDEVIRGTGLIDKVQAGVEDGGLEVAGIFDGVPQDSSTHVVEECAAAAKEAGADSFLAVGGGSVMDTAKVADAVFTHGGTAREQEGFFLMPRGGDGMGAPDPIAPLACIPTRRSSSRSRTFRSSRGSPSSTRSRRARCPRISPRPRAWTR
jgi:alcohol dehydrogenase